VFLLLNVTVFCKSGENVHDWMCLETDYLNLFANSFQMFIVEDNLGCYAKEPVFNLISLLGSKHAKGRQP
jgi:hypothetical protein